MSDQEEYRFPEEEDTSSSDDAASGFPDDTGEPEEWKDEKKLRKALNKAESKRSGASTRLLLLVLLLVVLAGAGVYFYRGETPTEPPPPPNRTVKKQPIAVPQPPVAKETVAASPDEKEAVPTGTEAAAEPVPPSEVDSQTTPTPEEPESADETEPATVETATSEAVAPEATGEQESGASGAYTVRAGAFLFKSHLAEAMDQLTRLGYEPQVEEGRKQVVMTRLRLGTFAPEEAEERMTELSRVAPGVFSMPKGEKVVVYAGSYYNLDKARRFADQLYKQGVRLEEETVELEVPLYLLSFDGFSEEGAAREAAERVREAGIETYVAEKD